MSPTTAPGTSPSAPGRPLPLGWRLLGRWLRALPHVGGSWRVLNPFLGRLLRGNGYSTVATFDRGQRIRLELDDWIAYQIFLTGFYDVETVHTRLFRRLVREGMVFVDVGANIGYYTLQAAVRVGPKGQVHAFEPVAECFDRLEQNVAMNGLTNVRLRRCVLLDQPGTADVHVGDATNRATSGLSIPPNDSGRRESVPAMTLDDYARDAGLASVDLVKIDVEGSELAVLKGMAGLLARPELQLLIEVSAKTLASRGSSPAELLGYLEQFGFVPWKVTARGLKPLAAPVDKESLVLFRKAGAAP